VNGSTGERPLTPPRRLRVLIADDEVLARRRLEDMLAREEDVEIVGTADDGNAAVDAILDHAPDLVFLDVQMPGKTGLEVVRTIGADRMPATIFVTAYDQHAVTAFDLAALDYLVKPFDDERFEQAFRRARRTVELKEVGKIADQLRMVLDGGNAAGRAAAGKPPYLERIAVEMRGQVRVVPVKQIEYIVASGPYAELHAGDRRYIIRERMQTLEGRLDPEKFLRIHRSAIVRLDLIETLHRGAGGDYAVQLKGGTKLKVSRGRVEELEKKLGVER
jgi:two-component system LytT family response regulator